jgi:Transglutaminase-like superfamily
MGRAIRLWRMSRPEKAALVRATLLLSLHSIALHTLPFSIVSRHLFSRAPGTTFVQPRCSREQVIRAISIAARYVPGATCVCQAAVAQRMLSREGYPAQISIGIRKEERDRHLQAHAWVESGGKILIGGEESPEIYTPIMTVPN